jgi:hypothetical protein
MPTLNPRLTITLEPKLAAQLRRISELTGNSQSKLISELLEGSTPVFDRLILVLTAAEEAKESMRGKLADDMHVAQGRMEKQLGLAMDEFNTLTGDLLTEVESIKRRARRTPGGLPAPSGRVPAARRATPLSNRGVRYDPSKTKVIKKRGA